MTKNALRWFLPVLLLFAAGFVVGTLLDLPLDMALYNPESIFGVLMEALGWYPAFLPALLLGALYLTQRDAGISIFRRVLSAVALLGGTAAMYFTSFRYLVRRKLLAGPSDPVALIWLASAVLLGVVLFVQVYKTSGAARERLFFFSAFGSVYLIAGSVVVQVLKIIWGRPRFDDMMLLGDFSQFRPWFLPFGPGGSSFPSAHTANAAGIFVLLILCDIFPSFRKRRPLITAACWVYVALMAFSRILMGRHFLTDTLAGAAIPALLFYWLHHTKRYNKALRNVLRNTA